MNKKISIYEFIKKNESFHKFGFQVIKNAFSLTELNETLKHLTIFYKNKFPNTFFSVENSPQDSLALFMSKVSELNPSEFKNSLDIAGDILSFKSLAFEKSIKNFLNGFKNDLVNSFKFHNGGLFFNKQKTSNLQYDWHQEYSYFKSPGMVLTLWFPLLHDIDQVGGPMLFALKEDLKKLPYNVSRKDGSYLQNTPLINFDKFLIISCNLKLGDAVIFNERVIHKTDPMVGKIPRVCGLFRYLEN